MFGFSQGEARGGNNAFGSGLLLCLLFLSIERGPTKAVGPIFNTYNDFGSNPWQRLKAVEN